jgi:four helix bundle protein
MSKFTRFEDLPVWQEAGLLYCSVLDLSKESSNNFSFGFRTQLDWSSLSVSNNIAEGLERMSTAELLVFLEFARGSAGEVRSMMAVIRRRMSVRPFGDQLDLIRGQAESCSKQIGAWMMSIERLPIKAKRHLTSQTYQQRDQEIENGRNGARRRPGGVRRPTKIKGQ